MSKTAGCPVRSISSWKGQLAKTPFFSFSFVWYNPLAFFWTPSLFMFLQHQYLLLLRHLSLFLVFYRPQQQRAFKVHRLYIGSSKSNFGFEHGCRITYIINRHARAGPTGAYNVVGVCFRLDVSLLWLRLRLEPLAIYPSQTANCIDCWANGVCSRHICIHQDTITRPHSQLVRPNTFFSFANVRREGRVLLFTLDLDFIFYSGQSATS